MKRITTTAAVIHEEGQPIFATGTINIQLGDEGGGPYLIITNDTGAISVDFDEWPLLNDAVRTLRESANHVGYEGES